MLWTTIASLLLHLLSQLQSHDCYFRGPPNDNDLDLNQLWEQEKKFLIALYYNKRNTIFQCLDFVSSYKHTERQRPMLVNGDAWKSVLDPFASITIDQYWALGIPLSSAGRKINFNDCLILLLKHYILKCYELEKRQIYFFGNSVDIHNCISLPSFVLPPITFYFSLSLRSSKIQWKF